MDTPRLTDERLRTALNGDQPSRERMCIALLSLDRNYTNIHPRRPNGGPDGNRDIECVRGDERCFGAVGFFNNVSDSAANKRSAKMKFIDDLEAAINEFPSLHAFVFFTNVDFTPKEIEKLMELGRKEGITFVDIYWRERIRQVLDNAEGLAIRYQYLSIPLSEAEQATFFSRFGSDLEKLIKGKFDSIEQKIDGLEYVVWKRGFLSSISLELKLRDWRESYYDSPEHFRVFLELQGCYSEHRSIMLGGRDDFQRCENKKWLYGTKSFFWKEKSKPIWIPQNIYIGGGIIAAHRFGFTWRPISDIMISEFNELSFYLLTTENIVDQISSVRLTLDNYIFVDHEIDPKNWKKCNLGFEWPEELTDEEKQIGWCGQFLNMIDLDSKHIPPKLSF